MTRAWPALDTARRRSVPRVPLLIDAQRVGSVAAAHLDALRQWPELLAVDSERVRIVAAASQRDQALSVINAALRARGTIIAWRDETYAIVVAPAAPPLALIERASARFWGTLTFGAHCNGYIADARGVPTHLWIARRSLHKATDPGQLDNLVGGGVAHGQSPFEALVREGFEEAGLDAATMRRAVPAGVIALACDIAEGFMNEHLHAFDLRLAEDARPVNQDGEVSELHRMPVAEAIEQGAAGAMTVDAALVTLDFALRHRLVANATELEARMAELRLPSQARGPRTGLDPLGAR